MATKVIKQGKDRKSVFEENINVVPGRGSYSIMGDIGYYLDALPKTKSRPQTTG